MLYKAPILTMALSYSFLSSPTCTHDACVNKCCFSPVHSSFKNLVCRATAKKQNKTKHPRQVKENRLNFSLPIHPLSSFSSRLAECPASRWSMRVGTLFVHHCIFSIFNIVYDQYFFFIVSMLNELNNWHVLVLEHILFMFLNFFPLFTQNMWHMGS